MTTISIAIATFNGTEYLGQQLGSIAAQTRLPDELIVSDDCSTDQTLTIVESFASGAVFPVRIFRNRKTLGFSRNFARALAEAKGNLIFLCDQDDVWQPDKIDRVAAEFERDPQLLALVHDERILDAARGEILDQTYFGNERALGFDDRELVSGNCTAIRRDLLEILLPFPEGINYDYWIGWMADILDCRRVLEEPLQLYRRHPSNATRMVLAGERRPIVWQLFRGRLSDPRPAWRETANQYRLIAERIQERSELVDRNLGSGSAVASIERLSLEIESLDRRMAVMSLARAKRPIPVLRNWRGGYYRHFSGFRSAIRDLLQPLT